VGNGFRLAVGFSIVGEVVDYRCPLSRDQGAFARWAEAIGPQSSGDISDVDQLTVMLRVGDFESGGHLSAGSGLASGHVAGVVLRRGGWFGAGAGWGFCLGHGSLQGGLEDLGFGEVPEGQAQSANAGNGDRAIWTSLRRACASARMMVVNSGRKFGLDAGTMRW